MENRMADYERFRKQYPTFIYYPFTWEKKLDMWEITYHFAIVNLIDFYPKLRIPTKNITNQEWNHDVVQNLLFHIGLVEMISYWKATCSPNVIIKAGYLDKEQMEWFKKLHYHGLGEFFFQNGITTTMDEMMNLICEVDSKSLPIVSYEGKGNLIPIGGGKDSIVTLELLKGENSIPFIMNPKRAHLDTVTIAGSHDKTIIVYRDFDYESIKKLNDQGFLNGHTPFSALLSFLTYLVAYLSNKQYIVLSNEGSANEATVIGTDINHQYSKSYQYENDFATYTQKYFGLPIYYFSFLRSLSELQIAMIFSNLPNYHQNFNSCNIGSKTKEWDWCCQCGKCLFVYIILSPFLSRQTLLTIFHEDLWEKESLLETFLQLLGYQETKPFDCVGTNEEVRYAVSLTIKRMKKTKEKLPYLLAYYCRHYPLVNTPVSFLENYHSENNLPQSFVEVLKGAVKENVSKYSELFRE